MKLASYWIGVLVIFFILIVIKNVPAQWGLAVANVPLQMSGVSGTLWNGKAATVVVPLQQGSYALGEVEWQLNPLTLLSLKPCADLAARLESQLLTGTACGGLNGSVQLKNTQIAVPAKVAEIFEVPLEIDGEILVNIESLALANNQIEQISSSGSWADARFYNSTSWVSLGTLGFDLVEDGQGGIRADIYDIEGPIQVKLDSQFNLNGDYNTEGQLQLRASAPREIGEMLNNYANVSRDVQEVLSLFLESRGPGLYSLRWVNADQN